MKNNKKYLVIFLTLLISNLVNAQLESTTVTCADALLQLKKFNLNSRANEKLSRTKTFYYFDKEFDLIEQNLSNLNGRVSLLIYETKQESTSGFTGGLSLVPFFNIYEFPNCSVKFNSKGRPVRAWSSFKNKQYDENIEWSYNKDNKLEKLTFASQREDMYINLHFDYNLDGYLKEQRRSFDGQDKMNSVVSYTYINNLLSSKKVFTKEYNSYSNIRYSYNYLNKLKYTKGWFDENPPYSIDIYEYGYEGRLISVHNSLSPSYKTEFKYNLSGLLVEINEFRNGKLYYSEKYDSNYNVVEATYVMPYSLMNSMNTIHYDVTTFSAEYLYDTNKNWVKRVCYKNKVKIDVTTRKIFYY